MHMRLPLKPRFKYSPAYLFNEIYRLYWKRQRRIAPGQPTWRIMSAMPTTPKGDPPR